MLLFLTAMLVNGAGSFSSVIAVIHLDTLSFAAIAEQFGHLPATKPGRTGRRRWIGGPCA
jgi:hypothetical protein